MDVNTILQSPDALGEKARLWVTVTADFIKQLSENNIELDFGPTNDSEMKVDYDAPTIDSYKRTYKPISREEIFEANKKMSEAIAGENYIAGFVQAVQIMMMFAGGA